MRNALASSPHDVPSRTFPTGLRSRVIFWTAAILGFLLLSLATVLNADSLKATASRTERFNATGNIRSLAVENISGDVSIAIGPTCSAVVEVTARARTEAQAQQWLGKSKASFENKNGDIVLFVEDPGTSIRRTGRGWSVHSDHDGESFRVDVRYTITVPAGTPVHASSVNGNIQVRGVSGELELSTVNGRITFDGARHDARLSTVNGNIDGSFAELPRGTDVKAETVNGNVTLRLPASAGFKFTGRTMSGDIASTFALPAAASESREELDEIRAEKERIRAQQRRVKEQIRERAREKKSERKDREKDRDQHQGEMEIDLSDLNRELAEMNRELAEMGREISRNVTVNLNRSYEGSVGNGGASIHCSNLNGRIAILREGSDEGDARSIVSSRSARIITVPSAPNAPHIVVRAPRAPQAPRAPLSPRAPRAPRAPHAPQAPESPEAPEAPEPPELYEPESPEESSIIRGNIQGDFYSSLPNGDITLGKVSGAVKVSTNSGQIQVESAGKNAELSSSGGDVRINTVAGELTAKTNGGDVIVGTVGGNARLETMGGDVRIRSAGGAVIAKTGGGDVRLGRVKGSVKAETAGGTVDCEIVVADTRMGSELSSHGGDVNVRLPANFKGQVDVRVSGVDDESDYIVSEFPELAVTRRSGSQMASGVLNGGGPKLTIRCVSGTVTIRKGPAV
ncbi:MAG: DUF4097 family beta strand repeat-containing protein [Thermoanaerobaculia bacterium]